MKKWRIKYKESWSSKMFLYKEIVAETEHDAAMFFMNHFSVVIFSVDFVGWA